MEGKKKVFLKTFRIQSSSLPQCQVSLPHFKNDHFFFLFSFILISLISSFCRSFWSPSLEKEGFPPHPQLRNNSLSNPSLSQKNRILGLGKDFRLHREKKKYKGLKSHSNLKYLTGA